MAGHGHSDPKTLPLVWREREVRDLEHFTQEWWSGQRGGGTVPKDFGWLTNPKQSQEENGAGEAEKPISR